MKRFFLFCLACAAVYLVVFPIIAAGESELYYDDGTSETGVAWNSPNGGFAVLFTPPSSKVRLLKAKVYFHSLNNPSDPMRIRILNADRKDLIAPINYVVKKEQAKTWIEFDLTSYNLILANDFYIAEEQVIAGDPDIGGDKTPPIDGRSWVYHGSYWKQWGIDAMIRAVVEVAYDISKLKALEEEFYLQALLTINLHNLNLGRITEDCIKDVSSLAIKKLSENDAFIGKLSEKLEIDRKEIEEFINSKEFKKIAKKTEKKARDDLIKAAKQFIQALSKEKIDNLTLLHQEFSTYISNHAGEFSYDRLKECEEGLKWSIEALKAAQKTSTGSINPLERLPFVYLGYRPLQINRVSMAVCAYDWVDKSLLADLYKIAFNVSGWEIGLLIVEFGIKPGIIVAAFSAIGADTNNVYAGFQYTFSAFKGGIAFHNLSYLVDDTRITPF
jgi:hypothetical protein